MIALTPIRVSKAARIARPLSALRCDVIFDIIVVCPSCWYLTRRGYGDIYRGVERTP